MPEPKVIRLDGPVILDWGNGIRMQLEPVVAPAGARAKAERAPANAGAGGRRGRKPSPATQALITAMEADKAAGMQRQRAEYLGVLHGAGYDGSEAGANQILMREAKRIFGHTLGRRGPAKKSAKRKSAKKATEAEAGRRSSVATQLARGRVEADAAKGELQDATHYVRWLVRQEKANVGLKGARPIVYRELRRVR